MINIFGAGPSGSIIARRYAEKGEKVNLYEIRSHVAGNLYDYVNDNGVIVHKYGPHIFQSSNDKVIKYVKKFSNWIEFRHKVNAVINDVEVPLPINFKSIDILFKNSDEIKNKLKDSFPKNEIIFIFDLLDSKDKILKKFGEFIYKNVFENYTIKMWDIDPSKIDKSVLKRVPIRLSYDDGYFSDKMQAVPEKGYTEFINNILDHKNINIILNAPKNIIKIIDNKLFVNDSENKEDLNIYTGPIDALFDYDNGEIPYRSLKFEFENKDKIYNSRYVVNYPSHASMTRITDYRLLSQQENNNEIKGTTIGREFPGKYDRNNEDFSEPYYPINNEKNDKLVSLYFDRIKNISNLKLIGRLAEYKYKQMSQAISDALEFKL